MNGLTYASLKVDIKFRSTVSEGELMEFRHYLRKKNQERSDNVVTIQDVKIVAIFLCCQQLPKLFHKFYNLWKVNLLLRACIVYMEFYLKVSLNLKLNNLIILKNKSITKVSFQLILSFETKNGLTLLILNFSSFGFF